MPCGGGEPGRILPQLCPAASRRRRDDGAGGDPEDCGGPRVDIGFAEVDLAALARGAQARGVTVNDALLGAVAAGFDALFAALGEAAPTIRVSVPVALPRADGSGNRVGVMLVELPLWLDRTGSARSGRRATLRARRRSDARSRGIFELTRSRLGRPGCCVCSPTGSD